MNPTQTPHGRAGQRAGANRPTAAGPEGAARRAEWVKSCARHLLVLDPPLGALRADALARELWAEVRYFDPEMAAELEIEGSAFDD